MKSSKSKRYYELRRRIREFNEERATEPCVCGHIHAAHDVVSDFRRGRCNIGICACGAYQKASP